MKLSPAGQRLCDDADCPEDATTTSIYTSQVAYCATHAEKLLALATALNHPKPKDTIRPMTSAEKKPKV